MESTLENFQKEFQQKYQDYQCKPGKLYRYRKTEQRTRASGYATTYPGFPATGQISLQHFGDSIQRPVITKAKKAVSAVAKENGYKYVLDTSQGFVLYFEDSDDLYALVAKKLGIKPKTAMAPGTMPKGK